jgi:hypothetical protein
MDISRRADFQSWPCSILALPLEVIGVEGCANDPDDAVSEINMLVGVGRINHAFIIFESPLQSINIVGYGIRLCIAACLGNFF